MGLTSPTHLIIILVLVLLLFGAKKIPELARGLGQGMKEFKAGVNEIGEDDSKDKDRQQATGQQASDEGHRETDTDRETDNTKS